MTAKKASKRRQKDGLPAEKYEPTPQEQAALDALDIRRNERGPTPRIKIVGDEEPYEIKLDHDEPAVDCVVTGSMPRSCVLPRP